MKTNARNDELLILQLKIIRECKDISQAELGKITCTKQEVISRLESLKNSPSLSTFCKLANALGYKVILEKE